MILVLSGSFAGASLIRTAKIDTLVGTPAVLTMGAYPEVPTNPERVTARARTW